MSACVSGPESRSRCASPPERHLSRSYPAHTAKVHWRNDKLATDWSSLKAQVDRWQDITGLNWSEQDITDVAFYLNILHYNYTVKD